MAQPNETEPHDKTYWMKVQQGAWAYLPPDLPPAGIMTEAVWLANSEADRAVGRLAGLAEQLPNPHLLIRPFIQREAIQSSQIEGTQAEQRDLALFEVDPQAPHAFDTNEVRNYIRALDYGLQRLEELPVAKRLIREMHCILMSDVRGAEKDPGGFRRIQNWIGPPGCTITESTYIPPPVPKMNKALNALERFIHHPPTELPPLVRMALIHYQFEAIHPFIDGNGRLGRLLITLLLCIERILPQPLLYLSAYLNRRREAYYQALLDVTTKGRWDQWLVFFLRGVTEQARDAVARARRLNQLNADYHHRLQEAGGTVLTLRLLDRLFASPATNGKLAATQLGVTPTTAYRTIEALVNAGMLTEVTGKSRGKIYVAEPILDAIESSISLESQ